MMEDMLGAMHRESHGRWILREVLEPQTILDLPPLSFPASYLLRCIGSGAGVQQRVHMLCECVLRLVEQHTVLRTLRACDARLHGREIELESL